MSAWFCWVCYKPKVNFIVAYWNSFSKMSMVYILHFAKIDTAIIARNSGIDYETDILLYG